MYYGVYYFGWWQTQQKNTGKQQLLWTSLYGLHAQCLLQVFLCHWESPQNNTIFSVSQVVVTAFNPNNFVLFLNSVDCYTVFWTKQFIENRFRCLVMDFLKTMYEQGKCYFNQNGGNFSVGHCVVCPSSIYEFWLPFWYLQALLSWLMYDVSHSWSSYAFPFI